MLKKQTNLYLHVLIAHGLLSFAAKIAGRYVCTSKSYFLPSHISEPDLSPFYLGKVAVLQLLLE